MEEIYSTMAIKGATFVGYRLRGSILRLREVLVFVYLSLSYLYK